MDFSVVLGPEIIRSYKRLSYTHWHALAEFVDNSTQAFFNNEEILKASLEEEGNVLTVKINYDKERNTLTIYDNSIGMDEEELQNALIIGKPPVNTYGRSKYGLGLKTAACWFGDKWTIKTKKLGEENEVSAVFDVDKVSIDPTDVYSEVNTVEDIDSHYTEIIIERLNRDFHPRTVGKIKNYLASMFRIDLNDFLKIYWQDDSLDFNYVEKIYDKLIKDDITGAPKKRDFDFQVNGKQVKGWVGVFETGSRQSAGFSIIQHNRVIKTWPEAYKPENIYGEQAGGSNNLVSQRLVGELYMDEFGISHTKDEILYNDNEQDILDGKLEEEISEFIQLAKSYRKFIADQRDTTIADTEEAIFTLTQEIDSSEFNDIVSDELPNEELVKRLSTSLVEETTSKLDPKLNVSIGELDIKLFINGDLSANDPYVLIDTTSEEAKVIVIANSKHPHWTYLKNEYAILNFLRHSVYDGVAEWKCQKIASEIRPFTVKKIKDDLLRLPYLIEGVDFS